MHVLSLLVLLGTTCTLSSALTPRNLDDFWGVAARAQPAKTTNKGNSGSTSTTATTSCATATSRSVKSDLYNVIVQPKLFKKHVQAIRPEIEKSCSTNQIVDWDTWTKQREYYTGYFDATTVKFIKKTTGFKSIQKLASKGAKAHTFGNYSNSTNTTVTNNSRSRRDEPTHASSSNFTLLARNAQATQKDATWNLAHISMDQATPPDLSIGGYLVGSDAGLTDDWRYVYPSGAGQGVIIYILDTGTQAHPDFKDRVISWVVVDDPNVSRDVDDDYEGHATQMAGVAAGTKYGVAKQAKISSIKVEGTDDWTDLSEQQGLQAALDQFKHYGDPGILLIARAMSVNDVAILLMKRIVDEGMHIVQSVGQSVDGMDSDSGIDECTDNFNIRIDGKIDVGAWTLEDERYIPSNWGECVDIFAPGSDIWTAESKSGIGHSSDMYSGTSHAAAHVSGALALILASHPNLKPKELKEKVLASARMVRDVEIGRDTKVLQLKGLLD